MEVTFNSEEFDKLISQKMQLVSKDKLGNTLKLCSEKIRADILQNMENTPRNTDVSYVRGNVVHHPSLPGNSPAPDTGNLRQSIHYVIENNDNVSIARIGTDVDYGKMLELGTSHIAPRPWLRPAFTNNEEFIKDSILRLVK